MGGFEGDLQLSKGSIKVKVEISEEIYCKLSMTEFEPVSNFSPYGTLAIDSGYTQLSLPLVEDGNDHWNCADEYTKRMYWSRDDGVVALFAPKGTHFEGHCWDEDGDFRGGDDYQGSFVVDSDTLYRATDPYWLNPNLVGQWSNGKANITYVPDFSQRVDNLEDSLAAMR